MGNSSSKDGRPPSRHHGHTAGGQSSQHVSSHDQRLANQIYGNHSHSSGRRGGSQSNLGFLSLGGSSHRDHNDHPAPERPRETKPEREARRAERERQARLKERERSMREESVDGGYLVTLGVYTGPEDFNKAVVRQLQIERRLAPFWRGLNDHSSSWTEAQLFAAARGLPIPAPDEVPPEMERTASQLSTAETAGTQSLMVPITTPGGRTFSQQPDNTSNLSASHPAFSTSGPPSPSPVAAASSTSPLFRGRAKTLASLASGGNRQSPSPDLTPQEIRLPADPYVNGTRLEAVLYKDATECPICFMYYPPYLNRTRCCAQDICSECFVQIKRPDPHPPEHEHHGPDDGIPRPAPTEEQQLLVSEVAACPFCVTPEFGVTYDPPPFRRGLAYAAGTSLSHSAIGASAMSSSSSLAPPPSSGTAVPTSRRRTTSLSASAPNVITTDRVRPDWAKKLADARAHALRRSAAATALHNAAYVLGNADGSSSRSGGLRLGRRRTLFIENHISGGSGSSTPRDGTGSGSGDGDLAGARGSSRRHGHGGQQVMHPRVEDLEELMMMEAIRLSLAAEEERKKKEEKEKAKENKRKAKEAEKEAKKAAKKGVLVSGGSAGSAATPASSGAGAGIGASLSPVGSQVSVATWASGSPVGTSSVTGKGKQAIHNDDEPSPSSSTTAPLSPPHARQLSSASSIASSILEPQQSANHPAATGTDGNALDTATSAAATTNGTSTPAATTERDTTTTTTTPLEFRSLAAIVDHEPQTPAEVPTTTTTTTTTSAGDEKTPTIKTVERISAEEGRVVEEGEKQKEAPPAAATAAETS